MDFTDPEINSGLVRLTNPGSLRFRDLSLTNFTRCCKLLSGMLYCAAAVCSDTSNTTINALNMSVRCKFLISF